jgi:tagatose 6-phosphate kinase
MVLTVTLNPLLERRLSYDSISLDKINRNGIEEIKGGGKGINVSRQLNLLKVDNLAFTFLGGTNGKLFRNSISDEKINFTSIKTNAETRSASIIIDRNKQSVLSFFSKNNPLAESEIEEFKSKLEKMIVNYEIIVFSGSAPCEKSAAIIPFGISAANKLDKISVCDTYGSHLEECLKASPSIIHNNVEELENSLDISLSSEEKKLSLLTKLYSYGIKQAFITDGGKEIYASNFDFHYSVENPIVDAVDSTGCGDAFTAGIVHGWHNDLTFNEMLATAVSLGVKNAETFDVCNIKFDEISSLKNKVKINPVGKKIKTINDSPR